MKGRVLLREAALHDLEEQSDYLAARSPDSALRFLGAAEKVLNRLAANPRLGPPGRFSSPLLRGSRSYPVPGFETVSIHYRPVENGIDVLRILHGARDVDHLE